MPTTSEAQRGRWRRGLEFQQEIIEALHRIPGAWVCRLPDHANESAADVLVLTERHNFLIEIKRIAGGGGRGRFALSDLRPNQIHGLLGFANACPRHISLLALRFDGELTTVVYLCDFQRLMEHFRARGQASITEAAVRTIGVEIPWTDDGWNVAAPMKRVGWL